MPVNNLIKLRRGTDWNSNPVLSQGEPGFDTTNNILKIGDGTTAWSGLSPIGSGLDYLRSHPNISAANSSDNTGRTYIQDVLLDSNGHVIGISTGTESVVNTDTTYTAGAGLDLSEANQFNIDNTVIQNGDNVSLLNNDAGYLTSFTETNDLSSSVTWVNVPNANITESSVIQHSGALRLTESQIVDLQNYLTSHPTIASAASSSDNSGRTYIQDVLLDSNGHVIGITTATETVTDTNTEYTAGTGIALQGTEFNIEPSLISGRTEATSVDADYLLIWDATDSELKKVDAGEFLGGGDIVDDTTPQLGGNLDINSQNITGVGNVNITGSGMFTYVDGTCGLMVEDTGGSGIHIGDCAYSDGDTYAGMKHSSHTAGQEYMIISAGHSTVVSSKAGTSTYIRAGGNATTYQGIFGTSAFGIGPDANRLRVNSQSVLINNGTGNYDFKVYGQNNATPLIHADAVTSNVGIGTGTPSYKLDVNGSGRFTHLSSGLGLAIVDSSGQGLLFGEMAFGTYGSSYNGDLYTGMTHTNLDGDDEYMILSRGDHTYISAQTGSASVIRGGANHQTYQLIAAPSYLSVGQYSEKMKFDSTKVAFNLNNENLDFAVHGSSDNLLYIDASTNRVGIGTDSPSNKLEVVSQEVHGGITVRGTNAPGLTLHDDGGAGVSYSNGGSKIVEQASSLHTGLLILDADTNNVGKGSAILFKVDNTEHVRITEDGSVGIGRIPDNYVLDVSGSLRVSPLASATHFLTVNDTVGSTAFEVKNDSAYTRLPLGVNITGSINTKYAIEVYDTGIASTGRFFFTAGNTNDAVGTYVANHNPSGDSFMSLGVDGDAVNWVLMNDASGRGTEDTFVLMRGNISSDDVKLAVTNIGNLGLGTDTPGANKFRIHHNTARYNSENTAHIKIQDSGSIIGGLIGADATDDVFYIQAIDPGTSWGKNISMQAMGGSVGIGTIDPGVYKFRVKGGHSSFEDGNVQFDGGNVTINQAGGNYDFRVEGDTDVNLFKTNASTDVVSIGADPAFDYVKFLVYSYDKQYQQIIGGGCSGVGLLNNSYINSGVTTATSFYSYMYPVSNTDTLNSLIHFRAERPVTASTGPVTTERGFYADVSGATTNNWGFQGIVPTGDNNYNLYMSSDAKNYLAGNLGIGDEGTAYNGAHRVPLSISPIDYAVTGSPTAAQQTNKIRVYDREGNGIAGFGVSTSCLNIATSGLIHQRFYTDATLRMTLEYGGKLEHYGTEAKIADGSTYELDISASAATLGGNRLQLKSTETVFNENGTSTDFRIEGDTNSSLFHLDAALDNIAIGRESVYPEFALTVYRSVNLDDVGHLDSARGIFNDMSHHKTTPGGIHKYSLGDSVKITQHLGSGVVNSGYVMGVDANGLMTGSGHLHYAYGLRTYAGGHTDFEASGRIGNSYGILNRVLNLGYGTMDNAYGEYITISAGSNGTIGNAYGVYIEDNAGTISSGDYGIYQNGSSASNYFAGKVGVGTDSPSYKLTVKDSSMFGGILVSGATNPGVTLVDSTDNSTHGVFGRDNGKLLISSDSTSVGSSASIDFTVQDINTVQATITSAGVGIGTTEPARKLHVVGDIEISGTIFQSGSVFEGGGGGGGGISNLVEDTTPQLGGNLDVNNKHIVFTSGSTQYANIRLDSSDLHINVDDANAEANADRIQFNIDGTKVMYMTSPDGLDTMHIQQQVNINTNGQNSTIFGYTENTFNVNKNNIDFAVHGDSEDDVLFVDASADSVGIGMSHYTNRPQTRLDVSGIITGSGFKTQYGTSSQFLKADGSVDTNTYSTTDTQLTEEQVEDFVGGMVTGNTETGITVTYDDSDGTLDFVVASQTDENFTTADHSKLDGIEASADVTDATNVDAAGAVMNSDTSTASMSFVVDEDNMSSDSNTKVPTQQSVKAYIDGGGFLTAHPNISAASSSDNSGNTFIQDITLDSNGHVTALTTATASAGGGGGIGNVVEDTTPQLGGNLDLNSKDITGTGDIDVTGSGHFSAKVEADSFVKDGGTSSQFLKADGSVDTNTYSTTDTQLTEEQVEDFVGGMLTGNTETGITVTYQDADGTIDFVVASQTDENFTTADHSKLDGIEASADVTDTANVTSAGALMDSEVTNLSEVKTFASSDYATAAQGTKADSAQQPPSEGAFANGDKTKLDGIEASADVTDTANVTSAGALMDSELTDLAGVKGVTISTLQVKPSEGAFADGDKTKLDAIEASATADQTDEEIQDIVGGMLTGNTETGITVTYQDADGTIDFVVASQTDENFTTADHSKLDGIEASADVTDTANVTSAGALMDSELTDLAGVKGVTISTLQVKPSEGAFANGDKTKLDAIEALADVTDATNVNAAGAVMNSDSTTAGMSFVVDEDNMASDSATKVPTQQSVKAYVDANAGGGGSMTTVKGNGSQVGGADIVTLDFSDKFTVAESPDTEINIGLSTEVLSSGDLSTTLSGTTGIHIAYNSSADAIGINVDPTLISSRTEVTSADADYLLVWDATDSELKKVDAGEFRGGSTLTEEQVEDFVGGMVTGNTETFITVTYEDSDGTLDFVVPVKDEDNMASNSATHLATQQSIKAYVDANAGGGGSMTTVKGNGSQVGGADIVTLDFSSEFAVTESPDTEINIALSSEILSSGDLSTTLSGSAGISLAYDSSADAIGLNVDINGSTDLTAPAVGDELIISDASDSNSIKKADVASVVNLADHDALTNFVANEHIDHTSVTLTAGDGLTGGGDISANRTFAVSVDDSTIEINSDALRIKDAAITPAKIGAGGFVFNEAGAAVDFRVEGDTEQNLLFVDGSADKIGIGTDSPAGLLHIKGEYSAGAHMTFEDTSSSLKTRLYNGNSASVIAVDEGDAVGTSSFQISVDNATKATFGAAATTFDQNVTINSTNNQAIFGNSITVLNEGGADIDFRVEGDTDTDLIYANAGLDKVGIGLSTPTEKLDVDGGIKAEGMYATTGLNVGVSGLLHQSGTIVHSTEAAWGDFPGNAQNSINLLTGKTTNATFTSLEMNNGMYSGVKLPSNKTFMADVNIVGRRTNTGATAGGRQHAAYQIKACIVNDAFGTALVGSASKTVIAESNSAWDVQLAFAGAQSGQTDYLLVQCKGAASTNVNWVAKVDLLEVGGLNETSAYREANILSNMSPEIIP